MTSGFIIYSTFQDILKYFKISKNLFRYLEIFLRYLENFFRYRKIFFGYLDIFSRYRKIFSKYQKIFSRCFEIISRYLNKISRYLEIFQDILKYGLNDTTAYHTTARRSIKNTLMCSTSVVIKGFKPS